MDMVLVKTISQYCQYSLIYLQTRNFQVSKEVVHNPEFGAVAVMQVYTICSQVPHRGNSNVYLQ